MKAKAEIRKITPAEAEGLLENAFEGQRKRRESHIQRLAEDMRLGRFRLSPDAVLICKDKLANGQHRLAAVVESGLTQSFIVMETDDTELFKVLDAGINRTIGDVISVNEYVTDTVAISRLICAYDKKLLTAYGGSVSKLARLDVIAFAEERAAEINEVIHFIRPLFEKSPIVTPSIMGAALMLAERKYNDNSPRQFVEAVYGGTEPESAAWVLRERMIKNASSKMRLGRIHAFALVAKGIRNYCNGNRITLVKLSKGEPFPEI